MSIAEAEERTAPAMTDLSKHQLEALLVLEDGPLHATELAAKINVGAHATLTMLQALQARGLTKAKGISRGHKAIGPRRIVWDLTNAGRAAIARSS
jgi:predicted ArsR family transcriptional regulator